MGSANLVITSDASVQNFASTNAPSGALNPDRQNTISLHPTNGTLNNGAFQADDLCGRIAHEMAHNIGARNVDPQCDSIMRGPDLSGTGNRAVNTVSPNDVEAVNKNFSSPNDCDAGVGGGNECQPSGTSPGPNFVWDNETCQWIGQCSGEAADQCVSSMGMWHDDTCNCVYWPLNDPILIDVNGDGFELTSAANGVRFDVNTDGYIELTAWTVAGSDDAFLALHRNGNETIDNGFELFGDATPQSLSATPNGFLALAEFDKPEQGGNADGVISTLDMIFVSLRLWTDVDHNGHSEESELKSLTELGLRSIEIDYKESKKGDNYGNEFRYRSKVRDIRGAQLNRWAWDVFLQRTR